MKRRRGLAAIAAASVCAAALTALEMTGAASDPPSSISTSSVPIASSVNSSADPGNSRAIGSARSAGRASAKSETANGKLPRNRRVFPGKILVAYYGTAHTGALGVLGEADPATMTRRLRDAARPFAGEGKKPQIVYELIVTVADASAGSDGNYSHDIPKSYVKEYIRAARRHHALLVLDFQPGREGFLSQVRRYRWALKSPFVGVALDPEWRMGPGEVPGQTIGSVDAAEVNRVSRYVSRLARSEHLRQKLFMLHQFRTDMVHHISRVQGHPQLAMVQHVDGFGTQGQKLATYHAVARPQKFHLGFKLFYDEDIDLFRPREVLKIKPNVQFISYQ